MKYLYRILILLCILLPSAGMDWQARADEPYTVFLPLARRSTSGPVSGELSIEQIQDNRMEYPQGQIPTFEKFELTFQVLNSVAQNPQFPHDPSPPAGIDPENPVYQGITVNAHFSPDNWQTTYVQPAFYYQDFTAETRGSREWYYPNGSFAWKVRFAPDQPGEWRYRLEAQDASGSVRSQEYTFSVIESGNPGFLQVSAADPRYFEFEDGSYFAGMGYNMNYDQVSWINPVLDNQETFQRMSENGIQLTRIWLSQWSIFTSAWNPWNSIIPEQHNQYIPFNGLSSDGAYIDGGSETSMIINTSYDPCMFIGWGKAPPAVRQNSTYRVRIRYKTQNISGPRIPGQPYGLAAKVGGVENGGWLWGDGLYCNDPGTGILVTEHVSTNTIDQAEPWRILEGSWYSGNASFLPFFYIVMENVTTGRAFIDYVWIEEDLGGGLYGENIISKPWMSHHLYFEQRNSFAFDRMLELAHQYGIYLHPVILEKNEWAFNRIQADGSFDDYSPSNDNFYGLWRDESKVRWLQQAWWRYLQARWGYSTNIHSWELLNEGDPGSDRHFTQADEMGKYLHCTVFELPVSQDGTCAQKHPNAHMVSTSNWHSFPAAAFWANPAYPHIDFADVHAYISSGWIDDPLHPVDVAEYHLDYSLETRARMDAASAGGPTKPVLRGESGLDFPDLQEEQPDLALDQYGVWLHNLVWASLSPGGMIEQYWWTQNLRLRPGPDGQPGLYEIYGYFDAFLDGIPLNNGHYQDAQAAASDPGLRVVGQKDTANNRAHLWVQNRQHTWRNVVNGATGISGLGGTLTINGFTPNTGLAVEWHEFTTLGLPSIRQETITTDNAGVLTITLPSNPDITDAGIKINQTP